MTLLKKGNRTYMRLDEIGQEFGGMAKSTVRNRVEEIVKQEKSRYGDMAVIYDGKIVLVNVYVFADYMANRRQLMDKNCRKYVAQYSARKVAEQMAMEPVAI